MIVGHLAELHLGHRAYARTEGGRNVREVDVERVFRRALQELTDLRPDVVVVVGDVFDRPAPPPSALLALTRGLGRFREALPRVPVVLVAGARDTPRRLEDEGALAVVAGIGGVAVVSGRARSLRLLDGRLHLAVLPHGAGGDDAPVPVPLPDPEARHNVLVAYGVGASDGPGLPVDPEGWSYVALGGEHTRRTLAPGVVQAGSLERVGSAPWAEAPEEKGFVTADLESGELRFHPVPVRPVVALAPVSMPDRLPETLRRRVREVTGEIPGGIEGKIVRLRLRGVGPGELLSLQGEVLEELRRSALHLELETEAGVGASAPDHPEEMFRSRLRGDPDLLDRVMAILDGAPIPLAPPAEVTVSDPEAGEVPVPLPGGLVGVASEDPSLLRRVAGGIAGSFDPGEGHRALLDPAAPGGTDDAVARWLDAVLTATGVDRVRAVTSSAVVDDRRAGSGVASRPREERPPEDRGELEGRIAELEGTGRELERLERELLTLRGDHVEVAGDVEVATMEWLRERQDAETHLQAYRDRARELKARLRQIEEGGPLAACPTCGRSLEDHYEEVVTELREEWESVVQDGRWWKRRREQLDMKPEELQEVEGRALRLQAAVEACAERVEEVRVRTRELASLRRRLEGARSPSGVGSDRTGATGEGPGGDVELLARAVREVEAALGERLLGDASRILATVTGGRIIGLSAREDGTVVVEGAGAAIPVPPEEDSAVVEVALRLAAARMAGAMGAAPVELLVLSPGTGLVREEDLLRLLDTLPRLTRYVRRIVLPVRTGTVDLRPERFDVVVELLTAPDEEGTRYRTLPAGMNRLVVAPAPSPVSVTSP